LVVFDTARQDAFEPYGAPRGATPAAAELAGRGHAFTDVRSTCNWTLPAHASLFTGLLPRTIGLGAGAPAKALLAAQRHRMLPDVLAREGWSTGGISANPWVIPFHGFGTGFDHFRQVTGRRHVPRSGIKPRARWARNAFLARLDDGMTNAEGVVHEWLDRPRRRPFFWFVNLMECHSPYLPPRPWNDFGPVGRFLAGEDARRWQSHRAVVEVGLRQRTPPPRALRRMRHLYARSVSAMDAWVGRVLEELDRRKLLDDTIVVVTSDHGENLGEGHLLGHGLSLDDRLLRVPFIAAGPGVDPSTPITSLVQAPAALAGWLGVDDHPWADGWDHDVAVAQVDPDSIDELAAGMGLGPAAAELLSRSMTCATDGRYKLVRDASGDKVHDLVADPSESTALRDPDRELVAHLAAALDAADARSTVTVRERRSLAAQVAESDEQMADQLRLLGYL
jgi:arylsulfatase A-like enzyme